ncbi:MAG: patatin-like phospholipase family protein [Syntrophothermus sp.]
MVKLRKILLLLVTLFISLPLQAQSVHTLHLKYIEKNLPFGLKTKTDSRQPSVSLVLSGGGSRSLSQIGVLKAFQERNIPVTSIVGTSMGSIIGGLYSAGYTTDELDSIVRTIPWDQFLTSTDESSRNELFVDQKITEDKALLTLRLEGLHVVLPTAINNGQRFSSYLNLLTLNAPIHVKSSFDELKYNYRAVCTDLITGNAVTLNKGSLSQAMRASSSVTLFISPLKQDSLLLVDGGLVANIPVQLARESGSDCVVAFNTTSPLNSEAELLYPWNVADQIVSIPMRLLSEQQLKLADVVITPELGKKRNTDFSNIDSIIDIGYRTTLPYLDRIESKLKATVREKLKGKEFFIKNVVYGGGTASFESEYIYKYSHKDSVSSFEILDDLSAIYKKGDYDSVYAVITEDGGRSTVSFKAAKNPEVRHIRVDGISILSQFKVDSLTNELRYSPYNAERINAKIIELLNIYRKRGYSLAELDQVSFDKADGELYLRFTEGVISKIVIEGNTKTREDIIRREFPIGIGDYFEYSKVETGLSNLRSTNLFNDISLTTVSEKNGNTVYLRVVEKPSSLLRLGLRIDNENRTQLSADIRDENIAGTGTELGLILTGGIRNRSYILEHKANRIFNTYLTYKIRAFYEFEDIYTYKDDPSVTRKDEFNRISSSEYRQLRQGFMIGLGMQAARFGNLIAGAKYQRSEIRDKNNYTGDRYSINIVTLGLQSTIDSQDKYPFPDNGFLIKGYYETAQKLLLGDVGYSKAYIDYMSHVSINNGEHTITPRIALGFADRTLPLSEHFSLGGQNSFFGLRENEFRGRQIFLSSIEYRLRLPVRLFFDTYMKFRYDLGSAWEKRELIRFDDLRHGAGATLSLNTPLGPADFSVGRSFLLKKNLPGTVAVWGPVMFYFTIGYYY